jgi:hypothetical protein
MFMGMEDGELPHGVIDLEEQHRLRQIEILKNQLAREVYLIPTASLTRSQLAEAALHGAINHVVVDRIDQNESEVA